MLLYGLVSDRYIKYKKVKEGTADAKPEHRLMLMVVGAVVLPLGLFLYGWPAARRVAWIAPLVGTAPRRLQHAVDNPADGELPGRRI
jgi:hypothetical protein